MSVASKRRFILNQLDFELYTPVEGDVIAQVLLPRGNNLHEVSDEFGEKYLVSMPSKFRKAVWIRKGQFVVVRSISEGDKVRAEIEQVLDAQNVNHIRSLDREIQDIEAFGKALEEIDLSNLITLPNFLL